MKVAASSLRKITLYLLTLLFVWVNGAAAPYQAFANDNTLTAPGHALEQTQVHNQQEQAQKATISAATDDQDGSLYGTSPAEENLEGKEESEGKNETDFLFNLPHFLCLGSLQQVLVPAPKNTNSTAHYNAVRKQHTYLLDCTFLI